MELFIDQPLTSYKQAKANEHQIPKPNMAYMQMRWSLIYICKDWCKHAETGRPQQQATDKGDVFKALSIFVHRFNLLFLF